MTMTTVPAQPGFDLVILARTSGGYKFDYYPIIAWIIDIEVDRAGTYYSSTVYPVCFDWDANHHNNQFMEAYRPHN
jgi:hypothetical protein